MRRAHNPHTKSRITFRTNWLVVVERMNIADFGFSLIFGSARFTALRAYPFCFFTLGWASFLASLGLHGMLGKVAALLAAALALALPAQFVQTL